MYSSRLIGAAMAFFMLSGAAVAQEQECAFGESEGDRGSTFNGLPYFWVFNAFADSARAFGAPKIYGVGVYSTANTVFELSRRDSAARKSKTYRSFIDINYSLVPPPPPRPLKAVLEIGGSANAFTVQERTNDASTTTIDLTPLYPTLIDAIRKGSMVHLTILDGDKKFIEQYFIGASMKKRFDWMESAMQEIFAKADAGKCPDAPAPVPPSGGGGGKGGGMGLI